MLFGVASYGAEKVVTLAFSSQSLGEHGIQEEEMCQEFGKRTNGRVKCNYFPRSTMTPGPQTFDSVMKGVCDIGFTALGYTPGRFPLMEVFDLPTGVKTSVQGTLLQNDFLKHFKPKELEQVHTLFLLAPSAFVIHSKNPVKRLEDLKGMKIRVTGAMAVDVMKTLGAVPVVISIADSYDALSKGVVDGIIASLETLQTFKYNEVTKYTTIFPKSGLGACGGIFMNKQKYESLPADVRSIIDKLAVEYSGRRSKLWDDVDVAAMQYGKEKGHTFLTMSPEEDHRLLEAMQPLFDKYVREKSAKGLPAREAVLFVKDWVKKNTVKK
jgi:TRAP-type C4-dicarboxylate transport system substrate-binding protein